MKKLNSIIKWLGKTKYPNATYTFSNWKFAFFIVGFEMFIIGLWIACEKVFTFLNSPYVVQSLWFSVPVMVIGLIFLIIGGYKVYNKNNDVSNVCARESTSSSEGGS